MISVKDMGGFFFEELFLIKKLHPDHPIKRLFSYVAGSCKFIYFLQLKRWEIKIKWKRWMNISKSFSLLLLLTAILGLPKMDEKSRPSFVKLRSAALAFLAQFVDMVLLLPGSESLSVAAIGVTQFARKLQQQQQPRESLSVSAISAIQFAAICIQLQQQQLK